MEDNFDERKWRNQYLIREDISNNRMGIFDDIDKDLEWAHGQEGVNYLDDIIEYCYGQIDLIKSGKI